MKRTLEYAASALIAIPRKVVHGAGQFRRNLRRRAIMRMIDKSYGDGYEYHQREVLSDPQLKEWVLKDNYL